MEDVGLAYAVFCDAVSEREDFELRGFVVLDTHLPVSICTYVLVASIKPLHLEIVASVFELFHYDVHEIRHL
jgi:hypothetical protein